MKYLTAAALLALCALPALAQESGTLKKVADAGSISMGIRESSYPLSYLDEKQQPVGYHIDICNRIVDAIKAQTQAAGAEGPAPDR
jgi:glutamate/aspartate transport system substrate-binding protein